MALLSHASFPLSNDFSAGHSMKPLPISRDFVSVMPRTWFVGLSMMSYRLWERKEDSFGGLPVERPHGEVVILPLSDSQLFLKILKGIEGVAGIEFFIVLSMTALHFSVVSGGVGLNELMPDAELLQGGLKERFLFGSLRVQPVREFRPVIRLDTFYGIWELFHHICRGA